MCKSILIDIFINLFIRMFLDVKIMFALFLKILLLFLITIMRNFMINNLNNLKKLISSVKNGYVIFINLKSLIFEWIEIKIDKNV